MAKLSHSIQVPWRLPWRRRRALLPASFNNVSDFPTETLSTSSGERLDPSGVSEKCITSMEPAIVPILTPQWCRVGSPSTSSGERLHPLGVSEKCETSAGLSAPGPQPEMGSRAAELLRRFGDRRPGSVWFVARGSPRWAAEGTGAVDVSPEVALQRYRVVQAAKRCEPI